MGTASHIEKLEALFKKEMLDLVVKLKDPAIPIEKKERARSRLIELEDLLARELKVEKGHTDTFRKKIEKELDDETKLINGGGHA
jgi:hypothetical protein